MRRTLFVVTALLILALGIRYVLLSTTPDVSPSPDAEAAFAANPLPPCPASPNCERTTRRYRVSADQLFDKANQAIQAMEPDSVAAQPNAHRLSAVFPAFIFKDDLDLAITPTADGAALHVRSASRTGYSDWSVNARRIADFFERLDSATR